ncbi:MAG: DUF3072 domain-containing protein [Thermoleophilia bacterium]|nr:DUF3072 domain-containing protein [Thermoleophilia bacterium]
MEGEEKQGRPGELADAPEEALPQDPAVPGVKLPADEPGQGTGSTTEKDPDDWVTGDEPMTGAQASYLRTLAQEANEPFDETLTKAEASKRIDELQAKTGRGRR